MRTKEEEETYGRTGGGEESKKSLDNGREREKEYIVHTMVALNIGISYILDFVSQFWSCKTNLEQKTWAMRTKGYERGGRRGDGKEERVEGKE